MVRIWSLLTFICASVSLVHADVVSNCVTLLNNAALTASSNETVYNIAEFNREALKAQAFTAIATASNNSGTSPTLDLKIQTCETATTTTCADTPMVFSQCTTGSCYSTGSERIDINQTSVNVFPFFRVVSTLAGTSPNYNVVVKICYK